MARPRIRFVVLGRLPPDFEVARLLDWNSKVFDVDREIENFQLNDPHQGGDWQYTDAQLEQLVPQRGDENILIALLNVPLEMDYYARRLENNRVLFTFHEMADILRFHSIPLENIALRVLYAYILTYRRYGDRVPPTTEYTSYAHDETRGCLFDMNASKIDAVHSCHQPIVCEYCVSKLKESKVSNEVITAVQSEIRGIRKPLFVRMSDFVHKHPMWSIAISLLTALLVGTAASLVASFIYAAIRPAT